MTPLQDDAVDDAAQISWLSRNSVLNRIATYLEETLAEWPEESDRSVGREVLRRGTVALRSLEGEWEYFQSEVKSDVDGLVLRDRGNGQATGRAVPGKPGTPEIRRQRRQLQAALRVLQREGWRDLEELIIDAVSPEYHDLVRETIAQSREEGNAPNSTVIKRAIEIASQEAQSTLRNRVATARKAIERRRAAMALATEEIKADVRDIENEIERAVEALKQEWRQSLAAGELGGPRGAAPASYSELREFIERIFQRSMVTNGPRPTLAELRTRWRAAVDLPARPAVAPALDAETESEPFKVAPASDLRLPGRNVAIVTTASIPWMTGTAVNPILRASYLAMREGDRSVTLVLPWVDVDDQARIFPPSLRFATPADQEAYIRWWAEEKGSLPCLDFDISWYPAAFSPVAGSIMPTTDIIRQLPPECTDVAILEEPEHLTWNHHGLRWNAHFNHVVGVAHTNYIAYAEQFGAFTMAGSWIITNLCVAAYCDVVIKLSDTLQWMPGNVLVRNVHGVRPDFLAIGARRSTEPPDQDKGAYFLGKALWAKGYRELIDLTSSPAFARELPGTRITCYGYGPDDEAIRAEAEAKGAPLDFMGAIDHAHDSMYGYQIFVNPSTSEVLCTATAEAVAMGKTVIIAEHPSNNFFKSFKNARFFSTPEEFARLLAEALGTSPEPLDPVERYTLSWEAATERMIDATAIPEGAKRQGSSLMSKAAFYVHHIMGMPLWGDALRRYANAVEWKPYRGYDTPSRLLVHSAPFEAESASKPLASSDGSSEVDGAS